MLSYHDVTVYVGNIAYKPSRNYALELRCTKVAGWELYHHVGTGKKSTLLGEEFGEEPFCIEVAGAAICGKRPKNPTPDALFGGWDGLVERKASGEIAFGPLP